MSWDQVKTVLTQVLTGLGAYAVGRGWISETLALEIVGVLLAVAGLAWSIWDSRRAARINTVAHMKGVVGVVTEAKIAKADPSPRVTDDAESLPPQANK